MLQPLDIAVAQPSCVPGDIAGNVVIHCDAVRGADTRLIVFPELSLSGYVLESPTVDLTDGTMAPLVDACREHDTTALVGAAVQVSDRRFIALLQVTGVGASVAYCKSFLGEDEAQRFSAGDGPGVIVVDGWRVGLGICKDTRIAEHIDATLDLGIDVYVAGLVHHAHEADELGVRAARITERGTIPVAFASAAGFAGPMYPDAAGRSGIWAADGARLAGATAAPGDMARTVLRL